MTKDQNHQVDTDVQESNPNGAGPERLRGDLGISSERTGPFGDEPADSGVQGTGSHGSAAESTDGVSDTSRADPPDTPLAPADGPGMDDTQHQATQSWLDELPAAGDDEDEDDAADGHTEFSTGIDRTVGESNTAQVPSQQNDPSKNPGHSHG